MVGSTVAPTLWDHGVEARRPDRTGEPPTAYRGIPDDASSLDAVTAGGEVGHRVGHRVTMLGADATTLDHAISQTWESVMGHRAVTCPWCEREMRPRYSAAALPVGARCADCGATLS